MIIQIDIDSTLYPADPLFAKVAKECGIDYLENANYWFTYRDVTKLNGDKVSYQEMRNMYRKAHSVSHVKKQIPYDNAAKVISEIRNTYDVDIYFVSDRHGQSVGPLREWLMKHKFISFTDNMVVATKDKRHWMRQNKPEIVIDDRVRTILAARYELNCKVIALQQNHNINLKNEAEGIYIEKDWLDIGKTLDKIVSKYFD